MILCIRWKLETTRNWMHPGKTHLNEAKMRWTQFYTIFNFLPVTHTHDAGRTAVHALVRGIQSNRKRQPQSSSSFRNSTGYAMNLCPSSLIAHRYSIQCRDTQMDNDPKRIFKYRWLSRFRRHFGLFMPKNQERTKAGGEEAYPASSSSRVSAHRLCNKHMNDEQIVSLAEFFILIVPSVVGLWANAVVAHDTVFVIMNERFVASLF